MSCSLSEHETATDRQTAVSSAHKIDLVNVMAEVEPEVVEVELGLGLGVSASAA